MPLTISRWLIRAGTLGLGALLVSAPSFAQTGQTAQIPLQFDFLNPGARSLGLGGAFNAVADDATAAYTNPAGLTQLVRPEVSAEVRYRQLDTPFLSGGRLSGPVSNLGVDTVAGAVHSNSIDSSVRPYLLSVFYPHRRWSFAAFRHELVLQNNSFLSQGPFQQETVEGTVVNNFRNFGLTGSRDITISNYGGAAAYRVFSKLSLGAEVSVYRFSDTSNFAALGFVGSLFGAANTSTAGEGSMTSQTGRATSVGVNAGALAKISSKVSAGFVWRQGVSFGFQQVETVPQEPTVTEGGAFRTPSVLGVGIRLQPNDQLSVAVDYDRVTYSRLAQDFIEYQVPPSALGQVSTPDGNEVHIGAEYTFVHMARVPSLRAGVWFDPNHAVQYTSDGSNSTQDVLLKAAFPDETGVWHYCFGVGMPLSRSYEVNFGADLASGRRYVSGSVVVRFGKYRVW